MQHSSKFSSAFERHFGNLVIWMSNLGVVWICALMLLICADIVGRAVFDSPIRGVTEVVSLSLVASVFLQIAYAMHSSRLTRADVLISKLETGSPGFAQAWTTMLYIAAAAMFVAIALGMWPGLVSAVRTREFAGVEGVFTMRVWPIKAIVMAGAIVAMVACLRRAVEALQACFGSPAGGMPRWLSLVVLALLASLVMVFSGADVEPRVVGTGMIAFVLILIGFGMPIAMALMFVGFVGLALLKQDLGVATRTMALAAEGTISQYVFAAVPLFVLMGLFVSASEIGRDAFRAAQRIFGRVYGGLGVATVAANAIFAAITGISIASAAIFSKIAVPELVRQGYTKKFALGLTAGSSVLGMLIPPSLLLIIYGVIAEVSIGGLFRAAVIPGILLATAFAIGVVLMAWLWPDFVGRVKAEEAGGPGTMAGFVKTALSIANGLLPVTILIVIVLGGIYFGVFTPTEAGAAGAFAAMCLALLRRRLDWPKLWEVMRETGQVSVTILFLIIAASTFSRMLTLTELPQDIAAFLAGTGLGMFGFLAVYLFLLIVLGTMLDSTSILLILLPLALPVVGELGGNLIWFGIVTVVGIEIGLLTPPLGLSVFVIKSSINDDSVSLGMIFSGAFPFVLITFAITILLMAFPILSLWLL